MKTQEMKWGVKLPNVIFYQTLSLNIKIDFRSTKKVAQHSRAAHKLALLDSCPHTFISAGEDGLIILVDLREPKPTNLLVLLNLNDTNKSIGIIELKWYQQIYWYYWT